MPVDPQDDVRDAAATSSSSAAPSGGAPQVRSTASGSRPARAQCSRRMPSFSRKVSTSPKACQASACSATRRSVTFGPPPPIRIGISRTGGGTSMPRRARMRGSAASSSRRREPLVPKSKPYSS